MVFILKPEDDAENILDQVRLFLADRGMQISAHKTQVTAATDGFDFLGWHFQVLGNGKFKTTPSTENYQAFRQKVKQVVNHGNYGASVKAQKLAPIIRGWRNYHRYCDMSGARDSLYFIQYRAYKVFNQETKQNRYTSKVLLEQAFPTVSYAENRFVCVKGAKSPYDGDLNYWSQRESKLYNSATAKAMSRQHHKCGHCDHRFMPDERVHLHHIDGDHHHWNPKNLVALHESCHDYIHMNSKAKA
jgi:RNA-directed DNA polymerase